ncbi:purine-cytosine permease family protein [Domibacillus iocasae]|uniref:Allantoin permease n=1 Tax=Domibacillus iocasae TaxID=1714016 RepID=A0A1E7DP19_9BACI|nr:cytosine permease [Domibacillus iocasae]OES44804.1 allantoin permease [Domibacillus iocasae]
MADFKNGLGHDSIQPVIGSDRSMNFFSTFTLWVAANFVITSVMTGMLFIPDISITEAMWAIFLGSAIGAIPLVLTGYIGTKTGLPTMAMARAAFGQKGAVLPAIINSIILIGWSWIQAYMAGLSLNYAVEYATGYSNINLFVILTEVLVVAITIYGHRGLERVEKYISITMIVLSFALFYKLFTTYDVQSLISMQLSENPVTTTVIAFDIVMATAFSWMSTVCDFNRYCKTSMASVAGTYTGYLLASLLAMGMGAVISGFSILNGMEQTYDPTVLLAQYGFGFVAAIVVFCSVVSTNVMALYSAGMSLMNVAPKADFWKVIAGLGIVCTLGALLKEALMANFYTFILLIATLFIPVFAIILVDYFILKKRYYNAQEILSNERKQYHYQGGINLSAYAAYAVGALFAYYFTYIQPLSFGSTVVTFFFSAVVYWSLMKLFKQTSAVVIEEPEQEEAEMPDAKVN